MEKKNSFLQSVTVVLENIQKLTKVQRLLICFGTLAVVIGAFTYFSYMPKYKKIKQFKGEYSRLSNELVIAKRNSKDLKKFQNKFKEKKVEFNIVKKALPEGKEIPALISSISQSGLDAGLEFLSFQPKSENVKDCYAEIPISVKVDGGYHNVAVFFDKLSRMARIVKVQDINMSVSKSKKDTKLTTSCQVVTYRFIEAKKNNKNNKKNKKNK